MVDLAVTIIQASETSMDCEIPDDMSIVEVVLDLVSVLRLPTNDSHGGIIPYRLRSKMLGRMLEDSETFESANVPEGDEILIAPFAVARKWSEQMADLTVTIIRPWGTSVECKIPDDMPMVEVVLDLVSELRLPTHDGHGAIIRFRLHSKMLGRMLEDSETLESANVPEGDEILIAPVVVAGGFPDVAHIFEAIATAMASGVVGNVAYDAIKGVVKRVKTRVKNKTECSPAPFDIEMLGFAAVVSRCNALGWSLPDPPELKVVHVIEKQFSDGTMYQLTIVCKEPDLRATVILHKEQISSFGAAVMLERS